MKTRKRIFSMLLCLVMFVGLIPGMAIPARAECAEHTWGDWETTTQPTCTAPGEQTRTCSVCGETETGPCPSLGHDFDANGRCTRCGYDAVSDDEYCAAAAEHQYRHLYTYSYEDSKQPCKQDGYEAYKCYYCGKVKQGAVIPATGTCVEAGSFTTIKEATCTTSGSYRYRCAYCGDWCETHTVEALGHDWAQTKTVRPTATKEGHIDYICTRCGATKSESIPALGTTYKVPASQYSEGSVWTDRDFELHSEYITTNSDCGVKYTASYSASGNAVSFGTSKDLHTKITISGVGTIRTAAKPQRYFMVLWAQHVSEQKFVDIVIDTHENDMYQDWGFDVYLVDFGTEGMPGIHTIDVRGNYINVYLVNCNIGYVEGKSFVYDGEGSSVAGIVVDGFDSHVYMGEETNASKTGQVSVNVTLNQAIVKPADGTDESIEAAREANRANYDPDRTEAYHWYMVGHYGQAVFVDNPVNPEKPMVLLQNLKINNIGAPREGNILNETPYIDAIHDYPQYDYVKGNTLEGYSNAWLKNCVLTNGDFNLYEFSMLRLDGSDTGDGVQHDLNLHSRSTAALSSNESGDLMRYNVNALGMNTVILNDANLYGHIIAGDTNDDDYAFLRWREQMQYDESQRISHYIPINGANFWYTGANLTLELQGSSTMAADNSGPDIMVDNQAMLTVKGSGALEVKDNGTGWDLCAAIGGTPAKENEDPKVHGQITIEGGTITATSTTGAAVIGGSIGINNDFSRDGGIISVRGGILNLTATGGGAALGGAQYGNGGSIGISGGTVNATSHRPYGNDAIGTMGAAAIGGGAPEYKTQYQLLGYQRFRLMVGDSFRPDFCVYPDEDGVYRYFLYKQNSYFNGDTETERTFTLADGVTTKTIHTGDPYAKTDGTLDPEWNGTIFVKKYEWVSGGGSGSISISGGAVVNASADNPGYYREGSSNTVMDVTKSNDYYQNYNNEYHGMLPNQWYDSNGNPIANSPEQNYYYVLDTEQNEYVRQNLPEPPAGEMRPYYDNGITPGYVIGSACEEVTRHRENRLTVYAKPGVNPVLMVTQSPLGVENQDEPAATPDHWFIPNESHGAQTQDPRWWDEFKAHEDQYTGLDENGIPNGFPIEDWMFYRSLIAGELLIQRGWVASTAVYGYRDENSQYEELLSGQDGYLDLYMGIKSNRAYRIRGALTWPGSGVYDMPDGSALTLLSGSQLNVPESAAIFAGELAQFLVEEGASISGKGLWPGKPAVPDDPPSPAQIKSILTRIDRTLEEEVDENGDTVVDSNGEPVNPVVVSHLAFAKNGSSYVVIPGYSADDLIAKAEALTIDPSSFQTIFNAGAAGFRKMTSAGVTTWSLNSWDHDTVVSLVENGALTATPGTHTTYNHHFDVLVQTNADGTLRGIELHSAKLNSPDYTVYEGQADDYIYSNQITLNTGTNDLALKISFEPDQVINNKKVFSVPKFSGSEFKLQSVAVLKNKCALRYGGSLSFTTPFADFGGVNVKQLQLGYGDGAASLGGIEVDAHAEIPSIGGFPVKGKGKLKINTFAPKRLYSLNVELETPIFEGAFTATFKEARGVILPDTLYAKLGVDQGGIPIVPPTVIGYIKGGSLGISGLADTVAMDSFGAPPLRLTIGAKGSIVDVISGWVELSVGLDGFDLEMSDIKATGLDCIKACGVSAKWDAGNRTIKGKKYWGFSADMNQYLVISVKIPGYEDEYGWDENDFKSPGFISATGSIGYGGFVGYYIEGDTANFIYQLHASGSLAASMNIPKGLVGGFFPLKNVTLGSVDLGFYAAANATTKVSASSVSGSPTSVLNQIAKNVKLDFDVAVGAKVVVGVGKLKGNVRVVYVLGDKLPSISGGWGAGKALDLSGAVGASTNSGMGQAVLMEAAFGEEGETIPAIVESAMRATALLNNGRGIADGELQAITVQDGSTTKSFTVDFEQEDVNSGDFIVIYLKDDTTLSASDLTITHNGQPFTPTPAVYTNYSSETGCYEAVEDPNADFDANAGVIQFAPTQAGTYTFTIKDGVNAEIEQVEAIEHTEFASLDQTATTIGSTSASYSVQDADAGRKYKVQFVLGTEEGKGDYLLAETETELTGADAYTGSLGYALTGSLVPTGSYYPSVLLLEYVTADDGNGNTVETWAVVDQVSQSTTVNYNNDTIPAAPASVNLAYSGNGTMTADWDAVNNGTKDADAYQIKIYEADGTDTGLIFRTGDASTSIIMDLSSLYKNGSTVKSYIAGVQAMFYDEEGKHQLSYERQSDPAALPAANKPEVTFSENVALGDGNAHTLTASGAGGSFTVGSSQTLTFTVTDTATGAVIASGSGESLKVTVPAPSGNETQSTLQVLAVNSIGDYALHYITVTYDTVAPPLMLSELGTFPVWKTEAGSGITVTGHSEAGVSIIIWQLNGQNKELVTALPAAEDGSFSIPLAFTDEPVFLVEAVDQAGNRSDAQIITFPADPITITFDPSDECATASGTVNPDSADQNSVSASCAVKSVSLAAGTAIGALPVPVSDDKLFDGWFYLETVETTEAGDTNPRYETVEKPVTGATVFTGNTTLYAKWADTVKLTYHPGDGAFCAVTETMVKKNAAIGALPEPLRTDGAENMMFLGWYTDENGSGPEVTELSTFSDEQTIYADWREFVTVTFDAGLGNCDVDAMKVVKGGTISDYPGSAHTAATGYTFEGWYTKPDDETTLAASTDTYSADTTLYARWSRVTSKTITVTQTSCAEGEELPDPVYTLPALPEGEEWVGSPIISYTKPGDDDYISNAKPDKPGDYTVTVQCETYECTYLGSAGFTITAVPKPHKITVADGITGGSVAANVASAEADETITLTVAPLDTSYALVSLTVTETDSGAEVQVTQVDDTHYTFLMPGADVTVNAVFKRQCTVTIEADEGCVVSVIAGYSEENDGTPVKSGDKVDAGTVLTVSATAKAGYDLTTVPEATYTVNGDLTITAASAKQTFAVTLTVDPTGGGAAPTADAPDLSAVPYGTRVTVTLGQPENGYVFIGWYQPNGKCLTTASNYTFTVYSDTELQARYQQETGVVIFMANDRVEHVINNAVSITGNDFPLDPTPLYGYMFTGWDKTVDEINGELSTNAGGVVIVTAQFTAAPVSVTVTVYNGENPTPVVTTYTESRWISLSAEPVNGKTFAYWQLDTGEILSYSPNTSFRTSTDCTVTAVYTTIPVTPVGTASIKTAAYDPSSKQLEFVAYLTVPDGAVIQKAGLLSASPSYPGSTYAPGSELTEDNADFVKVSTKAVGTGGPVNYTWTKTDVEIGDTWYVRPYVTYDYNGNTNAVYGDLVAVSAGNDYNSSEKGTAAITSTSYDASNKKMTFVAYLTVPAGGVITKAGVLASPGTSFDPTAALLTWDNAMYKKVSTLAVGTNGPVNYTWNKTDVEIGDTWHVRPYVIYTDTSGMEHTVYGAMVSVTAQAQP